jgi:hypothetical protein
MKGFGFVFLGIWILLFACLGVYGVVQAYLFDLRCGDYLKLAADASSVKMADDFLAKSIDYLNRTGKISGNSAIISSPLSAGPPSGKRKYVIRYHVGATSAHTVVSANNAADAVRWFQPYNHYGVIDEVYPAKESE